MIAAIKEFGISTARRTIRRYVVRTVTTGVAVIGLVGYRMITGEPIDGTGEVSAASAPSANAEAPAANVTASASASAAASASASASAPASASVAGMPQGISDLNAPKRAAMNAVDAQNAQLSAQTGQAVPSRVQPNTPISGPGSNTGVPASPAPAGAVGPTDPTMASRLGAPVTREAYNYEGDGRRDPFFSLILTEDLRPLLTDLRLVGILYEASGRRTVAIMRDLQTNAQYRVTNGMSLGRMRVTQIRPRAVIFSVDEFGLSRQDSLVWSDTTKVRN